MLKESFRNASYLVIKKIWKGFKSHITAGRGQNSKYKRSIATSQKFTYRSRSRNASEAISEGTLYSKLKLDEGQLLVNVRFIK